ncbi:MAG: gliding motility-associated C-terminal domain-containing protein [Saprospiraceae bacterium]|nr:gliding motility-associated C-terminal domain-containing protein [Saprospiraceae bacterium]
MKWNKHGLFVLILLFFYLKNTAQTNLVPNGDFEETKDCISGLTTFHVPTGWFTPQNTPINLSDPCQYGIYWAGNVDTFGINKSKSCSFETYGFFIIIQNVSHHRAYLAHVLKEPLVANQNYYFEMSFRTLDTVPNLVRVTTDFTDSHAIAFTNDFPLYDWSIPNNYISLKPILSHPLVKDYNWHKLKGCFTARGGEKYLIIGNFRSNAETTRVPTGKTSPTQYTSSTHVVDNIVLVPVTVNLKDTVVCQGQTVSFDVGNTLIDSLRYQWHDNSTTPQYKASKTERISAKVIYPTENCVAYGDMNFKVLGDNYKPIAFDTVACQGEKVIFTAGTNLENETIEWQNGSKSRQFESRTEGVYFAKIKNNCASWTDTFRLRLQSCGLEVFVPNTFSPNNDGANDDFKPFFKTDFIKIESYDMRIFNRWGSLVFTTKDLNESWDGRFKGQQVESGVYIWTIRVKLLLNGKWQVRELSGDVSILR